MEFDVVEKTMTNRIVIYASLIVNQGFSYNVMLERFSNECRRKANSKAIPLANHNENKTQREPIRNRSKYK